MRAALYARYSTESQRESSIEDQYRNCERYGQRQGWTIVARYQDKALSGASRARPGYQQLLADGQARQFDVLLVDDLSRLSRDDVEMKQVIRRFKFLGLRVIGVSDGFDTQAKGHKIHASVRGLINEIYLDDLREKTHRGLAGQVLRGNNAGGRAFGYRHIPIEDPTRLDVYGRPAIVAVRREVDPEQGRWVVWIYERFAEGWSSRRIVAEINRIGVPAPRGKTWAFSAVYGHPEKGTGILRNPLYIGQVTWNRSEWIKDPDTGKRKRRERPVGEWVTVEVPELRIISDDLWERVQARHRAIEQRTETARRVMRNAGRTGPAPRYLFSGLLSCGVCGAPFVMISAQRYGCSAHRYRGETVCDNRLTVARRVVETKLLEGIRADLCGPEALEAFKRETTRQLSETSRKPDTLALRAGVSALEARIARMVEAVAAGMFSPTLQAALEQAEVEKQRLETQLQDAERATRALPSFLPRLVDTYQAMVANLEQELTRDVDRAREQIRNLLGGQVKLIPEGDHLVAEMTASLQVSSSGSGGRI